MPLETGSSRSRWVLAAVSMALFCVQIDYFAMNLALPRMAGELGSSATDLQWVISVYMLTLGAFMVPAGRLGDIFGRKRTLLCGVALFGIASAAIALAPSTGAIVAFRAVQGLGAALIFPVSVSVLTNAFPSARASHAIGMAYGIAGLGNAAGPVVGGLLTETIGWRWIFWLNVPLTLIPLVIGALSITESRDESVPRRIDVSGLALVTLGLGLFTLTFDRAPTWGWLSPQTIAAFVGSAALLTAFVYGGEQNPVAAGRSVAAARPPVHRAGDCGHHRQHRLRRDDLPVDDVPAAGARTGSTRGRSGLPRTVGRCGTRRRTVGSSGHRTAAATDHGSHDDPRGGLSGAARRVQRVGRLPACPHRVRFHDGPGLRVHDRRDAGRRPTRTRGRSRRRHPDVLGHHGGRGRRGGEHVLEVLERSGISTANAINAILGGLACALLPAGVVVLLVARAGASRPSDQTL